MLNVTEELKLAAKNVKLVLFDLYGTLVCNTNQDNREELFELVNELEAFAEKLKSKNIYAGIISGALDEDTQTKLEAIENLNINMASLDKLSVGQRLIEKYGISFDEVLFIGDELFDLPLLRQVGISVSTQDARREVKRAVKFIIPIDCGIGVLKYFKYEIFGAI